MSERDPRASIDPALDAALRDGRAPALPPLSAALEAELAQLTPVTTRRPARQLALVVATALVLSVALLAVVGVRRDAGDLPAAWLAGAAALWLAGFALPTYLALVPPARSLLPRWPLAAGVAVVVPIGFVTLGLLVHPAGPASRTLGIDHLVDGSACLVFGTAVALAPTLLGALLLRRTLPVRSRWIAAALGAGSGCVGGLVLHLHCPIADGAHVGLIHGGAVVVAALLAALWVPRLTDAT